MLKVNRGKLDLGSRMIMFPKINFGLLQIWWFIYFIRDLSTKYKNRGIFGWLQTRI
jgi:hypothetical protein